MIKEIFLLGLVVMMLAGAASAAKGGMPAAHGVDGKTFGAVVSGLAQTDPASLADHVSAKAGGLPAAHGLSGSGFGAAVSGLAQTNPAALANHVRGK